MEKIEEKVLYKSSQFGVKPTGSAPDPASGQTSIPSQIQPYLQTPGIVLPQDKLDQVTNTTSTGNGTDQALPRLDGSAASFGSFVPVTHENGGEKVWADVLFMMVVAAFTILVVTN